MILIFNTKEERDIRNMIEAVKRGCDMVTTKMWWSNLEENEYPNVWGLLVGDGAGLTEDELAQCVNELPNIINE
jgi:hypothetical protein